MYLAKRKTPAYVHINLIYANYQNGEFFIFPL